MKIIEKRQIKFKNLISWKFFQKIDSVPKILILYVLSYFILDTWFNFENFCNSNTYVTFSIWSIFFQNFQILCIKILFTIIGGYDPNLTVLVL